MAISDTLATLKTIFVSRKFMKPVYFVVFINAVIFILVVSKVVEDEYGFYYALAFAAGKTLGVYFGSLVEERMALGILEINVFSNSQERMIDIADYLRKLGYSVNTHNVYGFNGKRRYVTDIMIRRKWIGQLKQILKEKSGKEPTMTIVTDKIK